MKRRLLFYTSSQWVSPLGNFGSGLSLRDHVFYYPLRKQATATDVGGFMARLAQLGDAELEQIVQQIPSEWSHSELGRISAHLKSVRDHAAEFQLQVLGALT